MARAGTSVQKSTLVDRSSRHLLAGGAASCRGVSLGAENVQEDRRGLF